MDFLEKEFIFSFHGLTFSIKGNKDIANIYSLIRTMLDILKKKNKQVFSLH